MLYIILALTSSTLIFVTFKLFERNKIHIFQAIIFNYIVATLLGFTISSGEIPIVEIPNQPWFYNALIIGMCFIVGFYLFALSTQKIGITITAIASKISVIIPVTLGVILYSEIMTWLKLTGIVFALIAFYLTLKKQSVFDFDKRFIFLPILLILFTGTNDSLMKFTEHYHGVSQSLYFVSTIFFSAMIIGISILLFNILKFKTKIRIRNIIAGVILGILNFISTYYFYLSLSLFDSIVFFPIFNVGFVIMSTIVGFFIFKEKLNWINWCGIILSMVAILFIALA